MAVREEGCSQYLINISPDATVKHINTLSPTVRVVFFFILPLRIKCFVSTHGAFEKSPSFLADVDLSEQLLFET